MKKVLLLSICFCSFCFAKESSLQQRLFQDIRDGKLDDFSHIEAAFIMSDVNEPDSLEYYMGWFNNLVTTIKNFHFDDFDRVTSAEKLFSYIRTTQYDEYKLEATTLLDIIHNRQYNCVSATILYNMVCEELGWYSQAFETPTHVYTIFTDLGQKVMVENTHPMGFNIMKNLHVYSQYLASFYPENQAYQIGLDRIYAYENSKGRVINNTELIGLLAYNQAFFAEKRGEYAKAYDLVLVAQDFNRDSRSNVNFERNLYYKWGKQKYEEGRHYDAFEVFADGYYRYPDNKDFLHNCKTAFFLTIKNDIKTKNWPQTRQVIDEIMYLEILDKNDNRDLKSLLFRWQIYFQETGDSDNLKQVKKYLKELS